MGEVDHRRPRPPVIDGSGGDAEPPPAKRIGDGHRHPPRVAPLPVPAVAAEGHPRLSFLPSPPVAACHAHVSRRHCPQLTAKPNSPPVEARRPVVGVKGVVHLPHPHPSPAEPIGGAADEGAQVVAVSRHGGEGGGGKGHIHPILRLTEVEEAGADGGDGGRAAAGGGQVQDVDAVPAGGVGAPHQPPHRWAAGGAGNGAAGGGEAGVEGVAGRLTG